MLYKLNRYKDETIPQFVHGKRKRARERKKIQDQKSNMAKKSERGCKVGESEQDCKVDESERGHVVMIFFSFYLTLHMLLY